MLFVESQIGIKCFFHLFSGKLKSHQMKMKRRPTRRDSLDRHRDDGSSNGGK